LGDTSQIGGDLGTGMSYRLISDNITAFIKALEEAKKLDVITRPQITTKDKEKATISLGREVPFITDTKVSTEGAISSTVKYKKVATKLEVTPQEMLRMTNDQRRKSMSQPQMEYDSEVLEPQESLRRPPYRDPLPQPTPLPEAEVIDNVPAANETPPAAPASRTAPKDNTLKAQPEPNRP